MASKKQGNKRPLTGDQILQRGGLSQGDWVYAETGGGLGGENDPGGAGVDTEDMTWKSLIDLPDSYGEFVWVMRSSESKPCLAYFSKGHSDAYYFQDPYTVGDSEGLSVEYYRDVILWAALEEPGGAGVDTEWRFI